MDFQPLLSLGLQEASLGLSVSLRESTGQGKEREVWAEGEIEPQADSPVSPELDMGLDLTTLRS